MEINVDSHDEVLVGSSNSTVCNCAVMMPCFVEVRLTVPVTHTASLQEVRESFSWCTCTVVGFAATDGRVGGSLVL